MERFATMVPELNAGTMRYRRARPPPPVRWADSTLPAPGAA